MLLYELAQVGVRLPSDEPGVARLGGPLLQCFEAIADSRRNARPVATIGREQGGTVAAQIPEERCRFRGARGQDLEIDRIDAA